MLRAKHIAWVLALTALAAGCQRRADESISMDTVRAEGQADQESWGAHFYISQVPTDSDESLPRLEMMADYLAEYEREDSTYMRLRGHPDSLDRPVKVYLFDAAGDSSATLTANEVLYFEKEDRFEARGNVVVVTQDGKRLEGEHLVWNEDERKVRTPGFVRIIRPNERVQGYGLVADEDLETYQLERVTAQVTLEDDP